MRVANERIYICTATAHTILFACTHNNYIIIIQNVYTVLITDVINTHKGIQKLKIQGPGTAIRAHIG